MRLKQRLHLRANLLGVKRDVVTLEYVLKLYRVQASCVFVDAWYRERDRQLELLQNPAFR